MLKLKTIETMRALSLQSPTALEVKLEVLDGPFRTSPRMTSERANNLQRSGKKRGQRMGPPIHKLILELGAADKQKRGNLDKDNKKERKHKTRK